MVKLQVWWSPIATCWRVEDGEMFTYYHTDEVVGHFTNRDRPAVAQMCGAHSQNYRAMVAAFEAAGVTVESDDADWQVLARDDDNLETWQ